MGADKKEVTVKGTMKPQGIATILEDLLDSFKKGKLVVQNGHEFVALQPSEQISLELEAAQKKGKEKLVIELSWEQRVEPSLPESGFKITSEEPPMPVVEEECEADVVAVVTPTPATTVAAGAKADDKADDKTAKADDKSAKAKK